MYTAKLSTNLTDPQCPEWEKLAQKVLGSDVHSDRKMGFFLSREALKNAFELRGKKVSISELELDQYHEVKGFPHLTISLSHTKKCGAAIIAERKDFLSVGIDVEDEGRVVKDSIRQRIAHPEDATLTNIELWCAKEAVFKAIMNTNRFEKPIEFGSIKILRDQWFHSPSGFSGEWKLESVRPFLMALAFLKN